MTPQAALAAVPPTTAPSARFSARVDRPLLDRLAAGVTTTGPRPELTVRLPFTGSVLGTVPEGTAEDIAAAAASARRVQQRWAAVPVEERAEIFLRFHDLIIERREEILDILQLEAGKARKHAFEDVIDTAGVSRYYAHTAPGALRPHRRRGAFPILTETWEHHPPKGLAGFVVPWNYPLTLGISDAIPALLAGNAVLIKPDQQTPYSALWAVALLEEAGLPAGLAQVVTGRGSDLGKPIVDAVDFLMFTGSTPVGRLLAAAAGERLIDSSMELGGKNGMIVLDDADLHRTVHGAVVAAFSNGGQLCISMERCYVQAGIYDRFVAGFVEATNAMRLGAALDYSVDMGSLVSAKQLQTVIAHVEDAVSKGARVLAGGRARPDLGPYFFEPTILEGVTDNMAVCCEETFGPVISVYRVETADEAIEKANASRYGLNFSVWSRDTRRAHAIAARLQAGTVNINEGYAAAWASTDAPMGGFKDSGIGRRHGEHGLLKYTEAQTIAIQHLMPMTAPTFLTQERFAAIVVLALKVLRRMPFVK